MTTEVSPLGWALVLAAAWTAWQHRRARRVTRDIEREARAMVERLTGVRLETEP